MPNNKRDKRQIPIGNPNFDSDYKPLSNAQWLLVQDKFGNQKIAPPTREQLTAITNIYSIYINDDRETRAVSDVAKEIEVWIRNTAAFRRKLGFTDESIKGLPNSKSTKQLFSKKKSDHEINVLQPFAHQLRKAELQGTDLIRRLRDTRTFYERDTEIWYAWAALIAAISSDAGLPIRHPQKKQLHSGFVFLLEKLQSTLLDKTKKVSYPRIKTGESLRKAALEAFKIGKKGRLDNLFTLFIFWCAGLIDSDEFFEKRFPEINGLVFRIERGQFGLFGKNARKRKLIKSA